MRVKTSVSTWLQPGFASRCAQLEQGWLGNRLVRLGHAPNLGLSIFAPGDQACWWLTLAQPDLLHGIVQSRVDGLPFADASFATVAIQHVHEYCADPHVLLSECVRVLVPGGRLLVTGFSPYAWSRWHRLRHGFAQRPELLSARRLRLQLGALGLRADPAQSLAWPDSRVERHVPLQFLHSLYLLIALKQPPSAIPLKGRPVQMPAGMVTG